MFRFQQWEMYQNARIFRKESVHNLIAKFPQHERFGLTDQVRRAMNSVILNIAEGSYRKTDKDFAHFLNQSMASLYEVVSCIDLAFDSKYIDAREVREYTEKAEILARQISAFTKRLQ